MPKTATPPRYSRSRKGRPSWHTGQVVLKKASITGALAADSCKFHERPCASCNCRSGALSPGSSMRFVRDADISLVYSPPPLPLAIMLYSPDYLEIDLG